MSEQPKVYVPVEPAKPSEIQQRVKAARKQVRAGEADPLDALASVILPKSD